MDLNGRKNMPLFSIRVVQKLTGLSARQIRYYEEHDLVAPARTEGNQRLFSFVDTERLLEIRGLLDRGLNMAGVKAYLEKRGRLPGESSTSELSDDAVYKRIHAQMQNRPAAGTNSEFQGDLSRFYRPKP